MTIVVGNAHDFREGMRAQTNYTQLPAAVHCTSDI